MLSEPLISRLYAQQNLIFQFFFFGLACVVEDGYSCMPLLFCWNFKIFTPNRHREGYALV